MTELEAAVMKQCCEALRAYRKAYGIDHRNQELAEQLDADGAQALDAASGLLCITVPLKRTEDADMKDVGAVERKRPVPKLSSLQSCVLTALTHGPAYHCGDAIFQGGEGRLCTSATMKVLIRHGLASQSGLYYSITEAGRQLSQQMPA